MQNKRISSYIQGIKWGSNISPSPHESLWGHAIHLYHPGHPPCGLTRRPTGHSSSLLENAAPDTCSTTALGDFNVYLELLPISWLFSFTVFSATMIWPSTTQLPSLCYTMSLHVTALLPSISASPFSELHVLSWLIPSVTPTPTVHWIHPCFRCPSPP